jgi:hypothetical protein
MHAFFCKQSQKGIQPAAAAPEGPPVFVADLSASLCGGLKTDSKCSNITARYRSHKGFGNELLKLNMMNQNRGSGF